MKKRVLRRPKITEIVLLVAHQLKTPLSVIKGCLEALISRDCGKINSLQEEYLSDTLENVKRVFDVIDDILDAQRIEEKKFEMKLQPVALEKVIEQVLTDFSAWIEASNCDAKFKKSKKLPMVLTDLIKVRQVIQNLIFNAVRYNKTGRGKVQITLKLKGKEILFSCKNNGISIPKSDFKKVFTKFYRSEEAVELDPSGSGLGLYINKAIVELSGGKIWFSKNKGAGMTFYFSLPTVK